MTALAEGWTLLARGDAAGASAVAARLLRDEPRNAAVAELAVEAAIVEQGWRGGLDSYDQWIAGRMVEDFYLLRRVARALLSDAVRTLSNPGLHVEVVSALLADGETRASIDIPASATPHVRAAAGDARAVAALAAGLQNDPRPVASIEALGRSGSGTAVAPLLNVLDSPRVEVRAAAATALGDLGATNATPRLRELLKDPQLLPRIAAAGSLLRLGDSSVAGLFQTWFDSDIGDVRLRAAQASAANPDANWIAQVRRLLQDPDPMTRLSAARLLGRHDPVAARWVLENLASDSNMAIREEAQRVLPESLGGDFTALRAYLRAADADVRTRAALRIVELTK